MLNRIITTHIPKTVNALNDPSKPYLTLAEEIPSDIGRSIEGYKRGGMLEGSEKLRKELMSALIWIAGIPAFQWLGDTFCEKALTIPMGVDFCKEKEGNNTIKDCVDFLLQGKNEKNWDTKELTKKYMSWPSNGWKSLSQTRRTNEI